MNIIDKKYWYFLISLLVIIPGLISLFFWRLNFGIDFTGGSQITFSFNQKVTPQVISATEKAFTNNKIQVVSVQTSQNGIIVRTPPINDKQDLAVNQQLIPAFGPTYKQEDYETVGPVIGSETTANAFKAIVVASILIVLYIAWSFRKVPKPASSWRFGICAIVALLHDVLVLIGLFSLFGHFFHVEVDSLFVTAVLTVIGFSVHDTIVVFDRIRENLLKSGSSAFTQVVNDSILQTLSRSLNTSLTAILVLLALLIFGGDSVRWFIVALLIGIISGTYSSIFNASPLLVVWQDVEKSRRNKSLNGKLNVHSNGKLAGIK
ncbi:MAG TPA: protein translocase subunit SecF [Patescibacteria group bacterium]|nr:protein translocase subunit SecF [Patescibacteria group bacterium]